MFFLKEVSHHLLSQRTFIYTIEIFLNDKRNVPSKSVQQYCCVTVLPWKMKEREKYHWQGWGRN